MRMGCASGWCAHRRYPECMAHWLNMAELVGQVGGAAESEGTDSSPALCMRLNSSELCDCKFKSPISTSKSDSSDNEAKALANSETATRWAAGNDDIGRCVVATVARNPPISHRAVSSHGS